MPTTYLCSYATDAGPARNILLDAARAAAGGFSAGSAGLGAPVPLHGKFLKVRGVYGKQGTKRMFLPCASELQMESIFSSGTFSVGGSWVVTGKRGERDTVTSPLP